MSPHNHPAPQDSPDLQDDPLLLELAQAVQADPPPDGRYAAAQRRLLATLAAKSKEPNPMTLLFKSSRPGLRWATATGLILVLAAGALFFNPFGSNPSQAYAAFAAALRKATTVSFVAHWSLSEGQPPANMRLAFREPALERCEMEWQGVHTVQILDTASNKSLILLPDAKCGLATDLTAPQPADRERLGLIKTLTQTVKELPAHAESIVGTRTIDGRKTTGFRSGESVLWIDVASGTLARLEKQMGGHAFVMSDFRLDPADLGPAAFSLALPAGYTAMASQPITIDSSHSGEDDLIKFLRLAAGMIKGHQFPATTNPLEILRLGKEGKLDTSGSKAAEYESRQFMQEFSNAAQGGFIFIARLKAENDWHYAGKDVTLGDAKTPIAWWKPSGLKTYRVIWGDLRVTEEPASVIPTAK